MKHAAPKFRDPYYRARPVRWNPIGECAGCKRPAPRPDDADDLCYCLHCQGITFEGRLYKDRSALRAALGVGG